MAIREQVSEEVRKAGITDPLVLNAFAEVDRKLFVPKGSKRLSYENEAMSLGHDGATISQFLVVAKMTEALRLSGIENVLEVGTGSGYGAAILSKCARWVHTIERNRFLAGSASRRLERLGFGNVTVHTGDGALGLPEYTPFDAIIVTAGAIDIPEDLEQQLAQDGRIVITCGENINRLDLILGIKSNGSLARMVLGERFQFVPLMSNTSGGWTQESLAEEEKRRRSFSERARALINDTNGF